MNQTTSSFSETRLFGTVSTEGNYSIENVSHMKYNGYEMLRTHKFYVELFVSLQ